MCCGFYAFNDSFTVAVATGPCTTVYGSGISNGLTCTSSIASSLRERFNTAGWVGIVVWLWMMLCLVSGFKWGCSPRNDVPGPRRRAPFRTAGADAGKARTSGLTISGKTKSGGTDTKLADSDSVARLGSGDADDDIHERDMYDISGDQDAYDRDMQDISHRYGQHTEAELARRAETSAGGSNGS